ncbi:hypothetical protein N658DRAFT_499708 [Parathielavia hyrcaniae]|uniref:Uncharacterized protein n=1 Tax=Parathielavia hyrcaniae TaxID=113614 RepID=A0AAN6SZ37_9PEZI|nr:hypothetical protein N658DRAFT_499708 [Parathielavia hyrcaniae]
MRAFETWFALSAASSTCWINLHLFGGRSPPWPPARRDGMGTKRTPLPDALGSVSAPSWLWVMEIAVSPAEIITSSGIPEGLIP